MREILILSSDGELFLYGGLNRSVSKIKWHGDGVCVLDQLWQEIP